MPKLHKPLGNIPSSFEDEQQQPTAGPVSTRVDREDPSRVIRHSLSTAQKRALWASIASLALALVEATARFVRSLK